MNLALRDMQSLIASIERGFKDGMDCGDMRVLQRYGETVRRSISGYYFY